MILHPHESALRRSYKHSFRAPEKNGPDAGSEHSPPPFVPHKLVAEEKGEVDSVPRLNGKGMMYHFNGIRGKVGQMRELVEVIDQMFDSFHKVNRISKTMFQPRQPVQDDEKDRRR